MLANKTITTLYNPGEKDREVLKAEFVIRLKEFNNIFNDIKTSKMEKPEQHYLLIGQRGSGKSTLIQRLRYAIEDDAELSRWLIPIAFTEEQYNITELGNLWERIAENLEDYHYMPSIVADLEKQLDKKDAEKKQLDTLLSYLRKNGKKIVVFIDNIGDMLKKFEDIEVKRLRSVLQTVPEIRIIAATPVMLDEVSDYQKALFEFFKNIRLGGLSKDEMETLLLKLGEIHKSSEAIEKILKDAPERIEIMRRLTGGIPRTVIMMYNVFLENADGNPIGDLQRILDDATPLYKHKMDDLFVEQQKIIDAVAKNWEAISARELARKLRSTSKDVSAHLRQLEKNQWIEKIETSTKNHLYQIHERFFNIWYLMRYGRSVEKTRVIWLVKFMESWLEKEQIEQRIISIIIKQSTGEIKPSSFVFWSEVFFACDKISPALKLVLYGLGAKAYKRGTIAEGTLFQNKGNELLSDMFENPEKLNPTDFSIFDSLIKHDNRNEAEDDLVATKFLTLKSSNAKKFWIKWLSPLAEKDQSGFFDVCLGSLTIQTEKQYNIHIQAALNKGNVMICALLFRTIFNGSNGDKKSITECFSSINKQFEYFDLYKLLNGFVLLLNNSLDESWEIISNLMPTLPPDLYSSHIRYFDFDAYFTVLISKNQYQSAYQLLTDDKLVFKESHKPIYYALMHYMKDEYPNEYLRMPPEMKETVEDVIKKIEEYKVKFA